MDVRPERYRCAGGEEWMLRFGPADGPLLIVALPWWEEGNRTRAVVTQALRLVANRGIGSVVPDWPGTGDSLLPTHETSLSMMRQAYASLVEQQALKGCYSFGVRAGALLDIDAPVVARSHWAPATGEAIRRSLTRLQAAAGEAPDLAGDVTIAGNRLSPTLLDELVTAEPAPARLIDLPGLPPWRRAEPGADLPLSVLLADDLASWITACEA